MTETNPTVESEIEEHKADLQSWVTAVESFNVGESHKSVIDRFVRDCKILITDLESKELPNLADLVDFTDRHNSLEIQFHNIRSDFK